MPELKIMENVPTEARLRMLVGAATPDSPETADTATMLIERHKMPFFVGKRDDGSFFLRSTYSAGELYLQQFITVDEETLAMKEDATKMAKSPHEVLIIGETGTGKELIAKSMIGDKKGAIKSVNCAGLPEELIESELFGHVSGAFTGAGRTVEGLMTLASSQDKNPLNAGVMFLDEIGELPMSVQGKLLRALQEKTIRKVGGKVEEPIDCKIVCATNRDLKAMTEEKPPTFKKDLYARISTLELHIKPLKERQCDVLPITESLPGGKEFLAKYEKELREGLLDISLNVRSLQQHVIRYNVLGRVKLERI